MSSPHGDPEQVAKRLFCLRAGRPTFSACGFSRTGGPWGWRGRWKCQSVCVDAAFGCHPSACFPVRFRMWYLDSQLLPPDIYWRDQSSWQHPETSWRLGAKSWQFWAWGNAKLPQGLEDRLRGVCVWGGNRNAPGLCTLSSSRTLFLVP